MSANVRRWLFWGVIGALVAGGLIYAFRPIAIPVDMVRVAGGPLAVTVDEEAATRIRDIYTLSAPVTGVARRIEADVGDIVSANETILAEIEPVDPTFLDVRTTAEREAALKATEAARMLARAEVAEAEAELEFAERELARAEELFRSGHVSERRRDDARRAFKARAAALDTSKATLMRQQFEVERARAALASPLESRARKRDCECVPVTAPVSGKILQVLHESEGVVSAGTPLIEIGDPKNLEVVADYLSADAVKITAGQRVIIDEWGGERPLEGRVRRIEPFGFMKVSALGIEEQRVNVIIDITDPDDRWIRLAHGYRVETRVVLAEKANVLQVPLTALFRRGEAWAVFVEREGRAALQPVTLGLKNGLVAEIVSGLTEGDRVIRYPSSRVEDGARIVDQGFGFE